MSITKRMPRPIGLHAFFEFMNQTTVTRHHIQ